MSYEPQPDFGTPAVRDGAPVTLTIDGRSVTVPEGTSVMRAAAEVGGAIPKLCATDNVAAYGSCRMCLVEIEGQPKPQPACAIPVGDNMVVRTQRTSKVADEAQHVKNPRSAGAKALRTIPARSRVALTGTPVENNLSELWAILDWTTPGLLGSHGTFRKNWGDPIEMEGSQSATRLLNRLVRPFLLRRRKSDPGIAPELPPKTITDQPVELTPEQIKLYEQAVRENMLQIRTADGINRRGLVLKLLTSLKQICNHPAQYLGEDAGPLAQRSGKLELLDELLDTIISEDSSVLVFTQYVAMARLLSRHMKERGIDAMLLHGGTAVRQRERMVERFQDGEVPVFLLSLKAAGTGLNLTRADHVIHYDRWWNPAVEEQATDRAHRIGQENSVQVHRLIAEGTIEDRIASIHEIKRELADAIVSTDVGSHKLLVGQGLRKFLERSDEQFAGLQQKIASRKGLDRFHALFEADPLVVDKWFTLQALSLHPQVIQHVRALAEHPDFTLKNPNRVRFGHPGGRA